MCRKLSQRQGAVQSRIALSTRSRYHMARRRERKGAAEDPLAIAAKLPWNGSLVAPFTFAALPPKTIERAYM